jgi:hypothetical protein
MHLDGKPNPRHARAVRRAAQLARAQGDRQAAARRERLAEALMEGRVCPETVGEQLRRRADAALRCAPQGDVPGLAGRDPWLRRAA